MEQLLPFYEQELATLRRDCREFAGRYPRIAGMLGMTEDACGDPHVERLIQACALLSARVCRKLDDDYPRFTEALLETVYPHYLRPFPSCSVIHIHFDGVGSRAPVTVARGTVMKSHPVQGVKCRFRTTSDIVLSTLAVTGAQFLPVISAPPSLRIDNTYNAMISLQFSSPVPLSELCMPVLRLFIDGDPSFCAALRDTLFMRTGPAYVEAKNGGKWLPLPSFPICLAGFDAADGLLPWPARSHPAYRLLTEYFAFPEKFNFIDIDLAAIQCAIAESCTHFTLHLPVRGTARDTALARTLALLGPAQLRTHCAPVINLFARAAAPVTLHRRSSEYPLLIDVARPSAYELHTIDAARLVTGAGDDRRITELQPFHSPSHGLGEPQRYWTTHRDDIAAACRPGHEVRIAIVDHDESPASPDAQILSLDVTCSNRDLPASLPHGRADGDLLASGILDRSPIRFLRKPTRARRFPADERAHWRLISHLTLNQRSLSELGVDELRQMLALYDLSRSPAIQKQIAGLAGLSQRTVMDWVPGEPCTAPIPGLELRLSIDETACVGTGLHVFAQLLDRFLALYGQINVFTRLILVSATSGEELLRCPPRSGKSLLA